MRDVKSSVYVSRLTRRESLKWLSALAATAAFPALTACSGEPDKSAKATAGAGEGHWPELTLKPVNAAGYGKDPDLIMPPESPWPRLLSQKELQLVADISDLIVPQEGEYPSATGVNIPDVFDEWISAPYERQQNDRKFIMPLLVWLDDEAALRHDMTFTDLTEARQKAILDDIATVDDNTGDAYLRPAEAFSRLRGLVLAAYFSSPEGTRDIGYQGNVAIAGDYPGPTDEAMTHINRVISELGLSEYALKS